MTRIEQIRREFQDRANPEKALILSRFFKTGNGEYGEGDLFLGITVPEQRRIARSYADLSLSDLRRLLLSRIHEHRLVALLILVIQFGNEDEAGKKRIADFYLKNTRQVNNWDLVDLSAEKILGTYLLGRDRAVLCLLARSKNLWERRMAIMATLAFIKRNEFDDALRISELLINDGHDLIHKAVGWMLREIGKRDLPTEEGFLREHYASMPRTMLRYAIERFEEKDRKRWLHPQPAKRLRGERQGSK